MQCGTGTRKVESPDPDIILDESLSDVPVRGTPIICGSQIKHIEPELYSLIPVTVFQATTVRVACLCLLSNATWLVCGIRPTAHYSTRLLRQVPA